MTHCRVRPDTLVDCQFDSKSIETIQISPYLRSNVIGTYNILKVVAVHSVALRGRVMYLRVCIYPREFLLSVEEDTVGGGGQDTKQEKDSVVQLLEAEV